MQQKLPIGEYLIQNGHISPENLQKCIDLLENQKYSGYKLGDITVSEGYVPIEVIGEYLDTPVIDIVRLAPYIDNKIFDLLESSFLRKKKFITYRKDDKGILAVAMVNIQSRNERNEIAQYLLSKKIIESSQEVSFYLSTFDMVELAIDLTLRRDEIATSKMTLEEREVKALEELPEEERPRKLLDMMISRAIRQKASDIHFDPMDDTFDIRFRLDGVLTEKPLYSLPKREYHQPIIAIIKTKAELNVAEKRIPQGGSINFESEDGTLTSDLRVSFLNTVRGEKCVIRLLPKSENILQIDDLALSNEQRAKIEYLIEKPKGMILVTGPTGSGKTTSLYAFLQAINDGTRNIMTAEDPVEMYIEGIHQIQVNKQIEFDFQKILREFLRQDPDVLLVGEIRDYETAHIASQAAETGHLVFSTLHTNSGIETINRLVNMGIPSYLLNASLNAVIAQRLVRKLCPVCKQKADLTDKQKFFINEKMIESPNKVTDEFLEEHYYMPNPDGCSECNGGFKGRMPVYEILIFNTSLKNAISTSEHVDVIQLTKIALEEGHELMYVDALKKAKEGIISVDEIIRIVE